MAICDTLESGKKSHGNVTNLIIFSLSICRCYFPEQNIRKFLCIHFRRKYQHEKTWHDEMGFGTGRITCYCIKAIFKLRNKISRYQSVYPDISKEN